MGMSSFASAFSSRKWPGYAISLLGAALSIIRWGWSLLDIGGRLDMLWRVAESVGGTPAMITTAIGHHTHGFWHPLCRFCWRGCNVITGGRMWAGLSRRLFLFRWL